MKEIKCELIEGISKKGKPYVMIKVKTGNDALDYSLKPIFLTPLQVAVLKETNNK